MNYEELAKHAVCVFQSWKKLAVRVGIEGVLQNVKKNISFFF